MPTSPHRCSTNFNPYGMRINQNARDIEPPNPYSQYPVSAMDLRGGLAYARPSSAHTGGVNVIFCGGNHRFIADEVPYYVYTQLMTPRQKGLDANTGYNKTTWLYLINEADY